MMSSFRPTTERVAPRFVPITFGRPVDDDPRFELTSVAADSPAAPPEAASEAPGIDPEEVEAREAEAYARGLAEGRAEAASVDAACAALDRAAERLSAAGAAALAANREGLIALAGAIARRWVGRELENSPDAFVALLEEAIARLPDDDRPRIRLAPADAERVAAAVEEVEGATAPRWRIVPDAAIAAGEFLVEGESTLIDGRAKAVLADLASHLADAVDAPHPDASGAPEADGTADGPGRGEDAS